MTLKKKMYTTEKSMKDFTICFRINLLPYCGKGREHAIFNAGSNLNWTTGLHYELTPVGAPKHNKCSSVNILGQM